MAALKRVLIANRGEIAVRLVKACRQAGLESVAVYSEADAASRHVLAADRAVCIGPPAARTSYLNGEALLEVARAEACDAIHPGYGFLSENADFVKRCAEEGIRFIGPGAGTVSLMGNKSAARRKAMALNVPVVPGTEDVIGDSAEAESVAEKIGFPLLLKARAGGGGRGMRLVHENAALERGFAEAESEANAAFGDGGLYMERFVERAKHIEVQVFADDHGNVRHLWERDCSVQRRHQKLIEESPSPVLSETLRRKICKAATALAEGVGYTNAGTVEFIFDQVSAEFFFIEMNTRIQVEHPVTEMLTEIDLIGEQLRVAAGEKLSFAETQPAAKGHVIEFRINAEDPARGFAPSPGRITRWRPPRGSDIRFDGFPYEGYLIPPFYDSLLGKLIVRGTDREDAIRTALAALGRFDVQGIKTTIPFYREILQTAAFRDGTIHTRWIDGEIPDPS